VHLRPFIKADLPLIQPWFQDENLPRCLLEPDQRSRKLPALTPCPGRSSDRQGRSAICSVADKQKPPTTQSSGVSTQDKSGPPDLLVVPLTKDLALPDDLPAAQELLTYGALVKRTYLLAGQGPVAHPCATEVLNRYGEM
jgi:hypothetical protein